MRAAERISRFCVQSGLSVRDLEDMAGLETGYLSRVLKGLEVPSCEILGRMSQVLEVPLERLFYDEGELDFTPMLTPRPRIEELVQDCTEQPPSAVVAVLNLRRLLGLV